MFDLAIGLIEHFYINTSTKKVILAFVLK